MVIINHSSYPHITDQIFYFTDPAYLPGISHMIRILDFDDAYWNGFVMRPSRAKLQTGGVMTGGVIAPRILRRMGSAVGLQTADTGRRFAPLPIVRTLVDYIDINGTSFLSERGSPRIELRACFGLYVIHLRWDTTRPLPPKFCDIRVNRRGTVRQVFIVLHPYSGVTGQPVSATSAAKVVGHFICSYFFPYANHVGSTKFTVIGLEQTDIRPLLNIACHPGCQHVNCNRRPLPERLCIAFFDLLFDAFTIALRGVPPAPNSPHDEIEVDLTYDTLKRWRKGLATDARLVGDWVYPSEDVKTVSEVPCQFWSSSAVGTQASCSHLGS